jgi:hypothetical protein
LFIENRDSHYRALWREKDELWDVLRKAPVDKLPHPIQKGFKKFFVLREDVARRTDAHIIKDILSLINSTVYFEDESFKKKIKLSRKASKVITVDPHLRPISARCWEQFDIKRRTAFAKYLSKPTWRNIPVAYNGVTYGYQYTSGRFFLFPWMYEMKIEPHFLTHVRRVLPEVESRMQEINNKFAALRIWRRLGHLEGWRRYDFEWSNPGYDIDVADIGTEEQIEELNKTDDD